MKIHTVYQDYRKKPYVARWYEGGRMRNRFFSTEEARAKFIESFQYSTAGQDPSLPAIEPHKIIRWQQAAVIAPEADPVEVYRFWSAAQSRKKRQETRSLAEATPPYLDAMERMKRHPSYIGHVRKALEDLLNELGDRDLREFAAPDLREHIFLAALQRGHAAPPANLLARRFRMVAQAGMGG